MGQAIGTTYRSAVASFEKFMEKLDVALDKMDEQQLKQLQRKVAEDPGWWKRKVRKLRNRSKLKVVTMAGFEDKKARKKLRKMQLERLKSLRTACDDPTRDEFFHLQFHLLRNHELAYCIGSLLTTKRVKNLTSIDLTGSFIRTRGAAWLAKCLPSIPGLTHLDLTRNCIEHVDKETCGLLIPDMDSGSVLSNLSLSVNMLDGKSVACISDALIHNHSLTRIDLHANRFTNVWEQDARGEYRVELDLKCCRKIDYAIQLGPGKSASSTIVTPPRVKKGKYDTEAMLGLSDVLNEHPSLTEVDLRSNYIGDDIARELYVFVSLCGLVLPGVRAQHPAPVLVCALPFLAGGNTGIISHA